MKRAAIIISEITLLFSLVAAQDVRNTENSVDNGRRSSLTVDPVTRALQLQIPLASYAQRGGSLPVALSYSSKVWQIKHLERWACQPLTEIQDRYHAWYAMESKAGWTASTGFPYFYYDPESPERYVTSTGQPTDHVGSTISKVARRILVMPDGSRHEMRADDDLHDWDDTITGKYYATDGSRIMYDSDVNTLFMPDGSRYIWSGGSRTFIDVTGNKIVYGTDQLTDTIGRTIEAPWESTFAAGDTSGASEDNLEYSLPGFSTGTLDYEMRWRKLSTTGVISEHESVSTLKYKGDWTQNTCSQLGGGGGELFESYSDGSINQQMNPGPAVFDPVVLHEIELPNGQVYTFKYNIYGEISKIIYPTGGYERFTYGEVAGTSGWWDASVLNQANRGVIERRVSHDGTTGSEVVYTYSSGSDTIGITDVRKIEYPDGTSTEYLIHAKPQEKLAYGFDNPLYGRVKEERQYSSTNVLLRRKLTEWTVDGSVVGGPLSTVAYKTRNPRVTKEVSVIIEGSSALAQTRTFTYDSNLNLTGTTEYDFTVPTLTTAQTGTISAFSAGTALRTTQTTYKTDSNYIARHLIGLPEQKVVRSGGSTGTIIAKTEFYYDESSSYPLLTDVSSSNWVDPSTNYRGLLTTTKSWTDIANDIAIQTHAQYDRLGNLRKSWDGNQNLSQIEYSSTYDHAYRTKTISPVPDSYGTYGSSESTETVTAYDYNTALPTEVKNLNLLSTSTDDATTTMEYNDPLLRPTKVTSPNGHQTVTEYGTGTNSTTRWVKVKSQIDSVNWREAVSQYDGLGRTLVTEKTDANGNVFTETEYDTMGRVKRSTNPYKTGETKLWTTPEYDDLSRVKKITSPDTDDVQTTFGLSTSGTIGLTKTVTDQAGKKRKGITDALGNMVQVIEDPDGSALVTTYTFDLLGNLRKTLQGDQSRYFMYDALGRLLFAKQPEQDTNSNFSATDPITGNTAWSVKYLYDANSNITTTTDARNQSITATYDKLNRITLRDYSDSATPDVSFYYDGTGLGSVPNYAKGKTTKVTSSVSETRSTSFDVMGRLLTSEQRTDGVTYPFEYTYNLSGALIEEKYPSGRVVKNTLNVDGELAQVQSRKNSNYGFFTYAGSFAYDKNGAVTKMQFGNGRWETAEYYADRLQVKQIGLGVTDSTQDLLKLEFKYNTTGQTDNNGSMREQKITVPTVGANAGFTATQTYAYDNLNRLESARETISSTQTWKQTFSYDRYGNRRFEAANTTTLGSCAQKVCNPLISTSDNRFQEDQDSDAVVDYDYDENGSLTKNASGERFGYDAEGDQKEYFYASNGTSIPDATYLYDGDGRRVKKTAGTEVTVFVYNATGQLAAEYATTIESVENAKVSYLTSDHLASPRIITDANGAVSSRKDFTAFGENVTSSQRVSGSTGNGYDAPNVRQDYTGYEKDAESGLEYAQARYYNPTHGRFTSVDPLTASATIRNPQTFNRYSYVLNSPYKFTDPLGLVPFGTPWNPLVNQGGSRGGGIYFTNPSLEWGRFSSESESVSYVQALIALSVQNTLTTNFYRAAGVSQPAPSEGSSGSGNGSLTQVIIWHPVGNRDQVQSALGHVSYSYRGQSWSWDNGRDDRGNPEWSYERKLRTYTDGTADEPGRRYIGAGTGYVLDFGNGDINRRFFQALHSAYVDTGKYRLFTNNCGHAFQRAINAIANELGVRKNRNIMPLFHERYITRVLTRYIVQIIPYSKLTAFGAGGGSSGARGSLGRPKQ